MCKTNINQFIFTRTQPTKKLEVIEELTESELLGICEPTLTRIVKETGRNMYKSRNKELYINSERRAGNNWNSTVDGVDLIKGRIYFNIYVQYANTDTSTSVIFEEFMRGGDYRGEIRRLDMYGNGRTYYFCYSESDKAEVLRSILLEFIYRKYNQKLQGQ